MHAFVHFVSVRAQTNRIITLNYITVVMSSRIACEKEPHKTT